MKKCIALCAAAVMALGLAGCGRGDVSVDATTEKYTAEDLSVTETSLLESLSDMGIKVDSIKYCGDDVCGSDIIEKLKENELIPKSSDVKECIGYEIDYHYPVDMISVVRHIYLSERDLSEQNGVQVWFVKNGEEDSEWDLVSLGYDVIGK